MHLYQYNFARDDPSTDLAQGQKSYEPFSFYTLDSVGGGYPMTDHGAITIVTQDSNIAPHWDAPFIYAPAGAFRLSAYDALGYKLLSFSVFRPAGKSYSDYLLRVDCNSDIATFKFPYFSSSDDDVYSRTVITFKDVNLQAGRHSKFGSQRFCMFALIKDGFIPNEPLRVGMITAQLHQSMLQQRGRH